MILFDLDPFLRSNIRPHSHTHPRTRTQGLLCDAIAGVDGGALEAGFMGRGALVAALQSMGALDTNQLRVLLSCAEIDDAGNALIDGVLRYGFQSLQYAAHDRGML